MFGSPARMFPRAPLWLSTGLAGRLHFSQNFFECVAILIANSFTVPFSD